MTIVATHVFNVYGSGVPDEIEPLVRRSRPKSGRTGVLVVRVMPESIEAIDKLAERRGWTRADAVRALLRAGLKAEGEIT